MYELDHTAQHLDIRLQEIGPGRARMTMRVSEPMVNGLGLCHGGYIFTLADTAMAYASNSYNRVAVAHTASITFTASGRAGELLTAIAEERHRKGRSGIYDVTVSGEDGRTVALFHGITQTTKGEIVPGLDAGDGGTE
jgi:acyl-CoA thioesterase